MNLSVYWSYCHSRS